MELTVVVHQDPAGFWSEVNELPGCIASAGTLSELSEALAEAVGLFLWDLPGAVPQTPLALGESTITVTPPAPDSA